MTIREMIGQGWHYARTCKSLWVFGFVVGLASGGSNGGSGGGQGDGGAGGAAGAGLLALFSVTQIAVVVAVIVLAILVAIVVRYISEGALIEGVVRARHGNAMKTREALRAGWAHWGVLLRIALLYIAATIGSLIVFVIPCVLIVRAFGFTGGLLMLVPAAIVLVPWLVTLYLVQAFASRIAVIENRSALDAISKARLFLHNRVMHGLKLMVASLVGTVAFIVVTVAVVAPVVVMLGMSVPRLGVFNVVGIGAVLVLPVVFVLAAMMGTFRSSVWTIGYLTQVES